MADGWAEAKLGEVVGVNPETTADLGADTLIRYVDLASVDASTGIAVDRLVSYELSNAPGRARRVIRSGDVVVSTVRPYLRGFAQVPPSLDGEVASTGFTVLRSKDHLISPGFVWLLVRTDGFVDWLMSRATGSNYPAVRPKDVSEFIFRLPPLPEQRRIVHLVNAVETLEIRLAHVSGAARAAQAAVRERAVQRATTVPLSELAVKPGGIQIGPFGSQLHARDYSSEGVPVVMPQDIIDGEIDEARIARIPEARAEDLARHRLRPGDIVLPRRGDLTKRALVEPRHAGWLCGTGCVRVRPRTTIDPLVLFEVLAARGIDEWLLTNAVGSTMPNLNTEIVGNVPVPVIEGSVSDGLRGAAGAFRKERRSLRETARRVNRVRAALIDGLLSGTRRIPESYDALLAEAASA